jgi:peptidoglycan/LPS O-acetylase OafA/YrhL
VNKINNIQALRGFAATIVVGYHLAEAAISEQFDPGLLSIFAGGEIGVDIFFVISGFIMYFIGARRPDMSVTSFLTARFWRILPPYWAILTLYVMAAIALAVIFGDTDRLPTFRSLLISYTLAPIPGHVIIIAWTLSIEILFYIIFALTFFRWGPKGLIFAMLAWAGAAQVITHFTDLRSIWLAFTLNTVVLEFLFGIAIAHIYLNAPNNHLKFGRTALAIGAFLVGAYTLSGAWHVGPLGREFCAGIPAAILVYGAIGTDLRLPKFILVWGESSYVLYLGHLLYFSISGKLIEQFTGFNVYGSAPAMTALLLSVILISYAITLKIERPYQAWYRKFLTA